MSHLINPSKQTYTPLKANDESRLSSEEQDLPLIRSYSEMAKSVFSTKANAAAVIAHAVINFAWTLSLLVVTILLLSRQVKEPFREWHETDIESARPYITRTPVKFTTGLYWNETTSNATFSVWNEDEPIYVGPRTPALDAAWDEITLPLDLWITEEEAQGILAIPQGMYQDPKTGNHQIIKHSYSSLPGTPYHKSLFILAEADQVCRTCSANVFISTTTLKWIPHGYQIISLLSLLTLALEDHCIEALRMNLMCTADMTPSPIWYSPSIDKLESNFEVVHSCRNFQPLLKWARRRSVHTKYDD
ncbi:hypothetical protein BOTNAR_0678g00070 [Botryotinia narcissicola]|uniref:Uncharacterized protein n=1 Tax=Botryotinia narcissicola TaxID=278944 RepID=A0A4Z1H8B0_9HELO|nr:hypothetical protein BOTNAR_0678g00070 [Botryotinia narcissicola]